MNAGFANLSASGFAPVRFDAAEQQLRKAFPGLQRRYSAELSATEIEALFVHYAFGLVEAYGDPSWPDEQVEFLRSLAGSVLGDIPASRALIDRPPPASGSFGRMIRAAEAAGRREGDALHSAAEREARAAELQLSSLKEQLSSDAFRLDDTISPRSNGKHSK